MSPISMSETQENLYKIVWGNMVNKLFSRLITFSPFLNKILLWSSQCNIEVEKSCLFLLRGAEESTAKKD
jgi:hypothetical protein